MDILELRMNYSAFIKLRNFVKINDISAEIKEYIKKNDIVNGKLDVCGNYLEDDLVKSNNFNEEIPFSIIFASSEFEVVDIDCVNLDYQTIDGRGIEVMFDVLIKYEDYSLVNSNDNNNENSNEVDDVIEVPVIINEKINDYEEIKEIHEAKIDKEIKEQLDISIDNGPTFTKIDRINDNQNEKKKVIKVCYYQDNKDLDDVCNNLNVGIDKIFNDNKNTDFIKYKRVIIK